MKTLLIAAALVGLAAPVAFAADPVRPGPERAAPGVASDRKITWAEFEKRRMDRFDRLDVNKDGRVSKEEWFARGRPLGGPPDQAAPAGPAGSARVFGEGGPRGGPWMMRRHMRMMMMRRHHMHGPGGPGRMRMMAFERMDINDDGFISRDEAERAARRLFNFLDLNGDGVLSGKELPGRAMGPGGRGGPRGPGGPWGSGAPQAPGSR